MRKAKSKQSSQGANLSRDQSNPAKQARPERKKESRDNGLSLL